MRWLAIVALLISTCLSLDPAATRGLATQARGASVQRLVDSPRVRVYRTTADFASGVPHGPAVVVWLEDGAAMTAGTAVWVDDAADVAWRSKAQGPIVIVQPGPPADASPLPAGSKPGDGQFTGMSFNPVLENDRVSALRARMEIGAREGFHTHGSDTIVVHVSGGEIEDTADGKTVVHRWRRGDAEFEARGSSHSARNLGGAVDVVLVVIKPRQPS
jgi:quercetin dioxygenase-like cupin family protein